MLIYRPWVIMVYSEKLYSEKLLNIITLMKCKDKGNNTSVKGSILTKLIGYRESMVLVICTKNESNLTNRY